MVLVEQLEGLGIDDRLDHVGKRVAHDGRHVVTVPAPSHRRHRHPQLLHLLCVRAHEHEHDLRVQALHDRPPRQQALAVERPSEGEHRALGDDRLVEVEESCGVHGLAHWDSLFAAAPRSLRAS